MDEICRKLKTIKEHINENDIEELLIDLLKDYNFEELGTLLDCGLEKIVFQKIYMKLSDKQKILFVKKFYYLFVDYQLDLIKAINFYLVKNSTEERNNLLKLLPDPYVDSYVNSLGEEEKFNCLPVLTDMYTICRIISTLPTEKKIKYIEDSREGSKKDYEKIQIIRKEFSIDEKKQFINITQNMELKVQTIVDLIRDGRIARSELIEQIETINDINAKSLILSNISVENRKSIISKFKNSEREKILNKIKLIEIISLNNEDIYFFLDYRMLENKYIEALGIDKISQISCYPEIEKLFLGLEEKELQILSKCMNEHLKNTKSDEWTQIVKEIVDTIISGEYKEMLDDIKNIEEENIEQLTKILQLKNIFEIKTLKQFNDYENIKNEKCDQLIKSNNINDKRLAICEKFFGHDLQFANEIIKKYGNEIEKLPDSDIKNYVLSLKLLMKFEQLDILNSLYLEGKETLFVDKNYVERTLKNEFCKLYNKGLLRVEDTVNLHDNIYEANDDFKMIIHSTGAFTSHDIEKNHKKNWNRKKIKSQYFSTSYITNEGIYLPYIPQICYGFTNMAEDSLVKAGASDIYSATQTFIPVSRYEEYYTPESLINNTLLYNELLYRRYQNGKKKQPAYIVVFRKHGKVNNMAEALKASEDWKDKNGRKMPIIIIDIDKYREKNLKQKKDNIIKDETVSKVEYISETRKIKNIYQYFLRFKENDGR